MDDPDFFYKDRHGSIALAKQGQVIVSEFTGPCSGTVARRYAQALKQMVADFNGKPWGYISCSKNFEAATDTALQTLTEMYTTSIQMNCRVDAYIIDSAVGRSQINAMRSGFDFVRPTEEVTFDDIEQARTFVNKALATLLENTD